MSLELPGAQSELLQTITAVQNNVIVVLLNGGPVAIEFAKNSPNVKAIIEAFQPGELGGDAILDVISGVVSPSGKMPYTTYTAESVAAFTFSPADGSRNRPRAKSHFEHSPLDLMQKSLASNVLVAAGTRVEIFVK